MLTLCASLWILEDSQSVSVIARVLDVRQFTEPIFVTLRVVLIEVRDLTLRLSSHQINREWQTDVFPSLALIRLLLDKLVRCTLIPHSLTFSHLVSYRTVEVLLIHEQVV